MIQKTRIMLYVTSVDANQTFWETYFQATVVSKQELVDGYKHVILSMQNGVELALFDQEFIQKYSPEVADHKPSLMFFSNDFERLHDMIPGATEINNHSGQLTFAFPDVEGNYYVVAKETSEN